MMRRNRLAVVAVLVGLSCSCFAAETQPAAPATPAKTTAVMDEVYPGLASDVLTYSRLTDLPEGVLLRSGDFTVSDKTVKEEVAKAPEPMREELAKQAFFLLEQVAAKDLLLLEAKAEAAKAGTDISKSSESEIMLGQFAKVVAGLKVADEEVAAFYRDNSAMFGGAKLDQVKAELGQYLLQQKQGEVVSRHVRTLGQRMTIEVSASWAKAQVGPSMDNPVGKVRQSGKPSMVDFGSKGCGPCDMMAPILVELGKEYEGKVSVLFIQVREQQILAARYGIEAIPVQVFFDKDGKEVFRHTGFFPKDQILKKLAEMGVK